tara:strand:- start:1967 stop:3364 length:1398 start_codon:yes stop_codon:yes gene_type:complete
MKENSFKNICCIGAGYVGGPTMSVIALNCPELRVDVVDINKQRIDAWNSDDFSQLPVYEPGLSSIVKKCRGINLFFSCKVEECISNADIIFISVNTPIKTKGLGAGFASDLKWIESSTRQIANFSRGHTIVVEKSTLPVKTAETIKNILHSSEELFSESKNNKKTYTIVSNPEFLAEGTAINDLQYPDRVLIGGEDQTSINQISSIYKKWVDPKKIITTNLWSAELSKLVANAFLAQRISSINSISALCESTGSNIKEVAKAIGTDSRIGNKFLNAGPGFGGSCFKKDILNLVYLCRYYGLDEVADYWEQIVKINSWQQKRISKLVVKNLFGTLSDKRLAILGCSFKANTNDTRESPSLSIAKDLFQEDATLAFYDPQVTKKQIFSDLKDFQKDNKFIFCKSALDACSGADAVLILTEWKEFKDYDWKAIFEAMRKPAWIFDSRNFLKKTFLEEIGFQVWSVGTS